ncbi:hypothetical protein GW835_00560 [archaeon]|nr:hypothetical protein [archaeon]NCP79047.1 hypothetical protein [archaeon]NCP97570.1 hypothetical protein [archaeon]NCQ06814.1 hypothetical protein [archaeon]NCQ50610.1 hypothetical protein [archaeon]
MDFERKKDVEILEEIVHNLNNISTNQNFIIKEINEHKFKDGFIIKSNLRRKLITLNYEGERIALLGFTIKNRNIEIQSIQGIKGTTFKHPSNWHQYLLTPFIASCLKAYQTPQRVTKYISFPDISSGVLEGRIKELKGLLEKINETNKSEPNFFDKKRISYYTDKLKTLNQRLIITKKIRDDYFTKEGFINLNKRRVSLIVNKYQEQINRLKNKKPLTRIKRLRKNTIKKR